MSFGLTEKGFYAKRLDDVHKELADLLTAQFGEIDVGADSVFGQLIGVLSKPLADLWEQCEKLYFSQYPGTADGVALDFAVTLTGITRRPATFSQGVIGLNGSVGTIVPALTQVATSETNRIFQTKSEATISLSAVARVIIKIDEAFSGETYSVSLNGAPYSYTAQFSDTIQTIATQLSELIATDIRVEVTDYGNGAFMIKTRSSPLSFVVSCTNPIGMSWWTPVEIISLEKGAISALAHAINRIITPVSGLDAVLNFESIDENNGMGNDVESDDALRLRRLNSLRVGGSASVEAIRARILALKGVAACFVQENVTDYVDANGLDPHSIKVIVSGGDEMEIAKTIWQSKAGGIKVMGGDDAVVVTFTDSQGNLQTISFFRPLEKFAYVDVTIEEIDENGIPSGYLELIANNILEWGDAHTIGQDLIYQQLFGVVFKVPGILKASIRIALMDDDVTPPDWKTENIQVNQTDFAGFSLDRITVQNV